MFHPPFGQTSAVREETTTGGGAIKVTEALTVQLFASVTVTVYVFAQRFEHAGPIQAVDHA
jgi:hypothetical protein